MLALAWVAVGWAVGLMLNRIAYQLPREHNPLSTPACESCGTARPFLGLPRRTCPSCGARLSFDSVEWLAGGIFGSLALYLGAGYPLLVRSLYAAILLGIAAIDWRHRLVFGVMAYPAIVLALVLTPTLPGSSIASAVGGLLVGLLAFGALYFGGRLLYQGREPMGAGDVTIAGLVGAMVGFPNVLGALFIGSVAVAGIGLLAMLTRRAQRGTFIPYGPGLCLGGLVSFFVP